MTKENTPKEVFWKELNKWDDKLEFALEKSLQKQQEQHEEKIKKIREWFIDNFDMFPEELEKFDKFCEGLT